ncbi:hypothetical protein Tsubulata_050238, partial [Turnera subulata]
MDKASQLRSLICNCNEPSRVSTKNAKSNAKFDTTTFMAWMELSPQRRMFIVLE